MKKALIVFTLFLALNLSFSQENEEIRSIEVKTIICNDYPIENKAKKLQFETKFQKDIEFFKYMSHDTIYVYLQKGNYKKGIVTKYSEVFKPHKIYDTTSYYNLVSKNNFRMPSLVHKRYYDFDAMEIDSITHIKKEKQSFLKKRKSQVFLSSVLTNSESEEIGYLRRVLYEIVSTRKKVYIIDEAENRDGKLTVRSLDISSFISDFSYSFF